VAGLGAFRVRADGEAILQALRGDEVPAAGGDDAQAALPGDEADP
jgi:hypothetical protein